MENKKINAYFLDTLQYCEERGLYVGEGNPNAKILLIGKEIGHGLEEDKTPSISKSNAENKLNLQYWRNRVESNHLNQYLDNITDLFRKKPNPTWTNYQKIVNAILGSPTKERSYDFLHHSFITELNQIHLPYSNHHTINDELIQARRDSIEQRKEMFTLDFFQKFPIVIMACGHYPTKDFEFNIEQTFNVIWDKQTVVLSRGNYYNIHHGKTKSGDDKILIHTRQASLGVTNQLLSEIGKVCRPFYKVDTE